MENNLSFEQLPNAVFQLYEKLNSIENLLLNKTNQQKNDHLFFYSSKKKFKRKKTVLKKRGIVNKKLTASKIQFVSKFVIRGIFEILKAIAVHIICT